MTLLATVVSALMASEVIDFPQKTCQQNKIDIGEICAVTCLGAFQTSVMQVFYENK